MAFEGDKALFRPGYRSALPIGIYAINRVELGDPGRSVAAIIVYEEPPWFATPELGAVGSGRYGTTRVHRSRQWPRGLTFQAPRLEVRL